MVRPWTESSVRIAIAVAAACFVLATIWNVLIEARIVVPPFVDGSNAAFFEWWRPHEWQTTAVHLLAAAGFVALAAAAGPLGATLLTVGGVLAAGAQLLQLGGEHAVLTASMSALDPGSLGNIGFTIDSATSAISSGAYATLGAGMVGLAASAMSVARTPMTLTSIATGVGLVLLGVLLVLDAEELVGPLTVLLGVVLFPAWAWVARTVPLLTWPAGDEASSTAAA